MSDLGASIWHRYAASPGAIPLEFGIGLASRAQERLPLLADLQARWSPDTADVPPVRWPEMFPNTPEKSMPESPSPLTQTVTTPRRTLSPESPSIQRATANTSSPTSEAAPAAAVRPVVSISGHVQRSIQRSPTAASPRSIERAISAENPAGFRVEEVSRTAAASGDTIRQSPADAGSQPDAPLPTPANSSRPIVQLREARPKILQRAIMSAAGLSNSPPAIQAAPSPMSVSRTSGATIQRSAMVDATSISTDVPTTMTTSPRISTQDSNESGAGHATAPDIGSGDSSSRVADEAMYKLLRRLAIERERRGGRRWL